MFSLRTLFLVVAIAALAAAALFAKSIWLISTFIALTLGLLCWSFLRREELLWRGLWVFGTVYLLCAVLPMFRGVSDVLPSTRLYDVLTEREEFRDGPTGGFVDNPFELPPNPFRDAGEYLPPKRLVLHFVAALLFGTAGGLLLRWNANRTKGSE